MLEKISNDYLTAKEVAALIPHTSYQTVLNWAKAGKLPSIVLPSGRRLFRKSDVEELFSPDDTVARNFREPQLF